MRSPKLVLPLLVVSLCAVSLSACGDSDGDGYRGEEDCDDQDPLRNPGQAELCNGLDDDCDPSTWGEGEGEDYDSDGSPACVDCDDQDPAVYPGAAPVCQGSDADCDGEPDGGGDPLGESALCPAMDCADLLARRPGTADGTWWIDGDGTGEAFQVPCDMSTDGGGWLHLALVDDDGVVVASRSDDNPWHKCDDDAASYYEGLTESDLPADVYPDGEVLDLPLNYENPETGEGIDPLGLARLRPRLTELHASSRMVATIGDNDGSSWQDGDGGGLEVYVVGSSGDWRLLTPGDGGDCGSGQGSWPSSGSETGFYLWGSEVENSAVAGDTGLDSSSWQLGPGEVLPVSVQLAVFTGGGVSFGWEQRSFRVR